MEFVDGVNLRQAMQASRFTPEQALAIVPPLVPLTWLGTLLLPVCAWHLWVTATRLRRGMQNPSSDGTTSSPSQPPRVREICAHLTESEKRDFTMRSLLFGLWNAGTFFGPFFFIWFSSLPCPMNWIYGGAILIIGLSCYPLWLTMQQEFLCTTVWTRHQGIKLPLPP